MKKIITLLLCGLFLFNTGMPAMAAAASNAKKATVAKSAKTTARIAFVIDGPSPASDYFLENFKKSITASVAKITMLFIQKNSFILLTGQKQVRRKFVIKHSIQMRQSLLLWVI